MFLASKCEYVAEGGVFVNIKIVSKCLRVIYI